MIKILENHRRNIYLFLSYQKEQQKFHSFALPHSFTGHPSNSFHISMGCQPSSNLSGPSKNHLASQSETQSSHGSSQNSTKQLRLDYRQFIKNDRGQIFEFYHFSKIISRSSTSLVRKVVQRVSKNQRICKIVPIQNKKNIHALKQVENLKKLDHPSIAQIYEYFFDKTYLYIIMENIPGRKLSQFMTIHNHLTMKNIFSLFQQLLMSVNYCHQKELCHNLIHPDNILIIEKDKEFFLKLIDFSDASTFGSPKIGLNTFEKAYDNFHCPENSQNYSPKEDVWSCGMVFIYLLSGLKNVQMKSLHTEDRQQEKLQNLLEEFVMDMPLVENILAFLLPMISEKPEKRPTIKQCLENKFFKSYLQSDKYSNQNSSSNKQKPALGENNKNLLNVPASTVTKASLSNSNSVDSSFTSTPCQSQKNLTVPKKTPQEQQAPLSRRSQQYMSRLVNFKVNHFLTAFDLQISDNLQSIFWMYASLNMVSPLQRCQYFTEFSNLDTNKDGQLDRQQILTGLMNLFPQSIPTPQIAQQYVDKIFSSLDRNHNHTLDFSQYVMATSMISRHVSEEELVKIFKEIDVNQDGSISLQEIQEICAGLDSQSKKKLLIQENNGKSRLNLKEFKELMFEMFEDNKKANDQMIVEEEKSK